MFDVSRYWYRSTLHAALLPLVPLSWLFGFGLAIRRFCYQKGFIKNQRFPVPILIVGNITVGGTGKTPFVIWLARFLKENGYRPGIVSRGVGGIKHYTPYLVETNDLPQKVGDEALLLVRRSECPVVICIDRPAAVTTLLQKSDCDIVISDDGLQHYRLARDIEIAIVDSKRRFGNGQLLPAGPLREYQSRLSQVDFVIAHDGKQEDEFIMHIMPYQLSSLKTKRYYDIAAVPFGKVHAIAGIGHPERFFNTLENCGFDIIPHVFPDHYHFKPEDIDFDDSLPIIMTEKDAVKCATFADERCWYLEITVKISQNLQEKLLTHISRI